MNKVRGQEKKWKEEKDRRDFCSGLKKKSYRSLHNIFKQQQTCWSLRGYSVYKEEEEEEVENEEEGKMEEEGERWV